MRRCFKSVFIIIFTVVLLLTVSYFNKNSMWQFTNRSDGNLTQHYDSSTVSLRLYLAMKKRVNKSLSRTQGLEAIDCSNISHRLKGKSIKQDKLLRNGHTWAAVTETLLAAQQKYQLKCKKQRKVAIIIPYRNRENQLMTFLQHIFPILWRQSLDFTVFVIEQSGGAPFNRAKLLNVGFVEATKVGDFDCYFLHDVDVFLEDDRCMYCADTGMKHFATFLNKFNYERLVYKLPVCQNNKITWTNVPYFGGVTRVTKELMLSVNGFSNVYWGWGAEDDDFYLRILNKGIQPDFNSDPQCTFTMLKHKPSPMSRQKDYLLQHFKFRADYDGLNSLKYKIKDYTEGEWFTYISVDIGHPEFKNRNLFWRGYPGDCAAGEKWLQQNIIKANSSIN